MVVWVVRHLYADAGLKEQESKVEVTYMAFYYLASNITYCHFYHILLV